MSVNAKLKNFSNTRQSLVQEDRLLKLQGIDVLDTGKKIQTWLIQTQPKVTKFNEVKERIFDTFSRVTGIDHNWMIQLQPRVTTFNEVTEKIFDVVSRVTGVEQSNIHALNFVALGRAMIKYNNEVLLFFYKQGRILTIVIISLQFFLHK